MTDKEALANLVKERAKLKADYRKTKNYRTHLKLVVLQSQIDTLKEKM